MLLKKKMQNTLIYYALLWYTAAATALLKFSFRVKMVLFCVLYAGLFVVLELADLFTGAQIWSQVERTAACYDWMSRYLKRDYGVVNGAQVFDLSESLYFGDFSTPSTKALQNKYEHVFKELKLGKGKKLLDCGCGDGTWMQYCKTRGVDAVGVTLSKAQQADAASRGLKVFVQDFRVLNTEFLAAFDAISLMGSTEHVSVLSDVSTMGAKSYRDYKALFSLLKQYMKPEAKILLISLVQNKPKKEWSWYDFVQVYVVQRHYGGYYTKTETIEQAIADSGFAVKKVTDYTKDYHWVSVAEPDHFGHWVIDWGEDAFGKVSYFFEGLFNDPFLAHRWLYYGLDSWMYHLGGYQTTPLTDDQVANSLCNLKYFLIA